MRWKITLILSSALIVGGAAFLIFGYLQSNPAFIAIGLAMTAGGVFALIAGFASKIRRFVDQKPNNNSDYAHAEIRTLIQSMGEMAIADGIIDPREVATIADIHQRMLGVTITTAEINEILTEFKQDDNVRKKLHVDRQLVNPAMKRMIIQSCYLVMIADGNKAGAELSRLHEIGEALGIAQSEVEHLITIAAD